MTENELVIYLLEKVLELNRENNKLKHRVEVLELGLAEAFNESTGHYENEEE